MKPVLKPFQRSLALIIIPLGFVLCFIYGWTFISTIFGLNNFYGNLYNYYHVSKISFSIYNLLVAIVAGLVTIRLILGILKSNARHLKRSLWIFLTLSVILVIGESILHLSLAGDI